MTAVLLEIRDDEMSGVRGSLLSLGDDWCSVLGYLDSLAVLYRCYARRHVVSVVSAGTATGRSDSCIKFSTPRTVMRRSAYSFPRTSANLS
jgi:hypothetical protein